jgi:LysM repeat protein
MAYEFYIDGVQLPIAPSKMQTKISNQNKTITLINEGEVNILKKPGLTEINFEVMIPQVKYPFATYKNGFEPASYYLDKLEALKTEQKKFQFIVSRVSPGGQLLFDTNMKVSLEDYTITEDAKEGLDLMLSIKLKQYVDFGTKEVIVKTNPLTIEVKTVSTVSVKAKREVSKETVKTYTVKPGDSLWAICKKSLGDGSKYPDIAKLNGISNPSLISAGQVLKLG